MRDSVLHVSRFTLHLNMPNAILDRRLHFPSPRLADAEGLVAVGGDLSVPQLLLAYRSGIFPWTVDPITWWSPEPRAIFELDGFHVSQSLARVIRKGVFRTTNDRAFRRVMEGCAAPARGRRSTWISNEFIEAYTRLHEQGHAHSLECWQGRRLVGGIYGVAVGGVIHVPPCQRCLLGGLVSLERALAAAMLRVVRHPNAHADYHPTGWDHDPSRGIPAPPGPGHRDANLLLGFNLTHCGWLTSTVSTRRCLH